MFASLLVYFFLVFSGLDHRFVGQVLGGVFPSDCDVDLSAEATHYVKWSMEVLILLIQSLL